MYRVLDFCSPYQDSRDTGIVSPPLSLSASLSFRHSTSVSAQTSFPVSSASVLTADARGDHIHDDDEDLFGEFPYSPPDSECMSQSIILRCCCFLCESRTGACSHTHTHTVSHFLCLSFFPFTWRELERKVCF